MVCCWLRVLRCPLVFVGCSLHGARVLFIVRCVCWSCIGWCSLRFVCRLPFGCLLSFGCCCLLLFRVCSLLFVAFFCFVYVVVVVVLLVCSVVL